LNISYFCAGNTSAMNKKIVAFGELVWDIFQDGRKMGGAPVNLVYRVNTLGDQGFLVSRVGNDQDGAEALKMLDKLVITRDYVQIDPDYHTGTARVKVGSEGRPDYLIDGDLAFDRIALTPEMVSLAGTADCICFGTLVQRSGISGNTLKQLIAAAPGALKMLDLKLRKNCYTRQTVDDSLRMANVLRVKENELYLLKNLLGLFEYESRALAGELASEYHLDVVLVTRSKAGAFGVDSGGNYFEDKGYVIDLVDTVGSGVAFSAGFLHLYLEEKDPEAALRFGNAAGALTAETHGATIPISKKQITELIRTGKRRG